MRRFFVAPEGIKNGKVQITGSDAHHLSKVLRLKENEKVIVIDGSGLEYTVNVKNIGEEMITGEIIEKNPSTKDTEIKVTIVQGIPKGDKMDLIVQKCTELGVARIIPVLTERTIVKLDNQKKIKKQNRWQKIAQEGAKQCKRATVPEISSIYEWKEFLSTISEKEEIIILWEDELSQGLKKYLQNKKDICSLTLVIGPEGGLSEKEVNELREKGAKSVSLGPRILRTETAGFAALTMVLYELGDLG